MEQKNEIKSLKLEEKLKDVERLDFFFEKECVYLVHDDVSKDGREFGVKFVDIENSEIRRVQVFKDDQYNRGYGTSIIFKKPQTLIKDGNSIIKGI